MVFAAYAAGTVCGHALRRGPSADFDGAGGAEPAQDAARRNSVTSRRFAWALAVTASTHSWGSGIVWPSRAASTATCM
jgi:hypothetical protein